jgi:hypothetical protein
VQSKGFSRLSGSKNYCGHFFFERKTASTPFHPWQSSRAPLQATVQSKALWQIGLTAVRLERLPEHVCVGHALAAR